MTAEALLLALYSCLVRRMSELILVGEPSLMVERHEVAEEPAQSAHQTKLQLLETKKSCLDGSQQNTFNHCLGYLWSSFQTPYSSVLPIRQTDLVAKTEGVKRHA